MPSMKAHDSRPLQVAARRCKISVPQLVGLTATGAIDPTRILTQTEPITDAIEAYRIFDQRQPGWIKVELNPAA